ncbi:hypothetical protein LENED_007108 [Lentinula edodes]|uniref:Uncharacterized protein n=1 Tax=Lentinula edodes TaxID=5353 RepID=A0A1Q3EDQ5_LENED|nr:hypothetical protein LENED_007108 [Lentinula edodes]
MQSSGQVTGATQAKERLYTQLAGSFGRMNRALVQTSNLCELLQQDLHAMRTFVGLDAAMLMTVAASLNVDHDDRTLNFCHIIVQSLVIVTEKKQSGVNSEKRERLVLCYAVVIFRLKSL